ncbi:hypothetical protein FBU30_009253 [Linnemannia zychae]|nr:hypothetical protein FBU30_009253 [Linnemannia zychae]
MKILSCWLMLATISIPLLSVTASTIGDQQQQSFVAEETHHTMDNIIPADENNHYPEDIYIPIFGPRIVPKERTWQILGPFPTGMREQDFGADPLEAFGGFRQLKYDTTAKFPSELAQGGLVGWNTTEVDWYGWTNVHFPDIKWSFNQFFLGWEFNQFQAWARTTFIVPDILDRPQIEEDKGLVSITIQCENVGDLYVDDERLSGDWYGYGLTRHTLQLKAGTEHTLSVRVVHEIRIFGGVIIPPPSKFKCELSLPFPYLHKGRLGSYRPMVQAVNEGTGGIVVMDVVDGVLAGDYISVALRNVGSHSILVKSVKIIQGSQYLQAELADRSKLGINIFPSTHRPIAIRLKIHSGVDYHGGKFSLRFEIVTLSSSKTGKSRAGFFTTEEITIGERKWGEPYLYTFRDFDGTVHYAAAIPPSNPSSQPADSAPILVALHGAGVEVAQSPFWLTEYTQRERTWIILPTGRSPWGYDWHGMSIKNVMSALNSLAHDLPGVPSHLRDLPGICPDPNRLFIAGHSNGGQGAWFMVTHFPDKAIAATPAAGYVNIKQYVPYVGWQSNSYTDAYMRGILESSIVEFDNDVHMSNTVGIPILARTGSVDDNVPPFHSRKMVRLGNENAHNTAAIRLSEVPGEGHWFKGVLQDTLMETFLKEHLHDDLITSAATEAKAVTLPPFPTKCVITVLNPSSMDSKCGIQVEQLQIPYRKGTIVVDIIKDSSKDPTWVLATKNIRRFGFSALPTILQRRGRIGKLIVDGSEVNFSENIQSRPVTFVRSGSPKSGQVWKMMEGDEWKQSERHRETYGPAIQILEKRVVVVLGTYFHGDNHVQFKKSADRIAKLVAHDIYQYGRGDVEVLSDDEFLALHNEKELSASEDEKTNLILIGDRHQNKVTQLILEERASDILIDTQAGMVSIQSESDSDDLYYRQPGTGLLMIRPWGPSNLAMVIAGLDPQGLETAARLFPKRTGMLVPDWILTGSEMAWKGAGGILSAGYWGNHWEYLPSMSA